MQGQSCPHGHRRSPAPPPRPARRSWGLSGQPRCTVKTIRHVVLHEEAGVDRGTPWICAKAREAVAPGQAAGDRLKPGRGPGSVSTAVRGVASVAVMLPKPLVCPSASHASFSASDEGSVVPGKKTVHLVEQSVRPLPRNPVCSRNPRGWEEMASSGASVSSPGHRAPGLPPAIAPPDVSPPDMALNSIRKPGPYPGWGGPLSHSIAPSPFPLVTRQCQSSVLKVKIQVLNKWFIC